MQDQWYNMVSYKVPLVTIADKQAISKKAGKKAGGLLSAVGGGGGGGATNKVAKVSWRQHDREYSQLIM